MPNELEVSAAVESAKRLIKADPSKKTAKLQYALGQYRQSVGTAGPRFSAAHGGASVDAAGKLMKLVNEFGGGVPAVGGVGSDLSPREITIVARTGGIAVQEVWGRCFHDFSGFISPVGKVILDWDHTSAVIGVCDKVSVQNGKLLAVGRLVPFKNGDEAQQIIFKLSRGVPFNASLVMSNEPLEVEAVREGKTASVNGLTVVGPCCIFRKWSIEGISVVPYGADSSTSVAFTRPNELNHSGFARVISRQLSSKA